jgi:hypothetical protein
VARAANTTGAPLAVSQAVAACLPRHRAATRPPQVELLLERMRRDGVRFSHQAVGRLTSFCFSRDEPELAFQLFRVGRVRWLDVGGGGRWDQRGGRGCALVVEAEVFFTRTCTQAPQVFRRQAPGCRELQPRLLAVGAAQWGWWPGCVHADA